MSDFLNDQMGGPGTFTHRELAAVIRVAPATATRLLHDERVPHEETLMKIANAFEEDIRVIRDLARRPTGEAKPFELPQEFNQLTPGQRDVLKRVGWELLYAQGPRVNRS